MDGLPPVSKCQVEQCFYNIDQLCHAPAINVGGEMHPACDTSSGAPSIFIARRPHWWAPAIPVSAVITTISPAVPPASWSLNMPAMPIVAPLRSSAGEQ